MYIRLYIVYVFCAAGGSTTRFASLPGIHIAYFEKSRAFNRTQLKSSACRIICIHLSEHVSNLFNESLMLSKVILYSFKASWWYNYGFLTLYDKNKLRRDGMIEMSNCAAEINTSIDAKSIRKYWRT